MLQMKPILQKFPVQNCRILGRQIRRSHLFRPAFLKKRRIFEYLTFRVGKMYVPRSGALRKVKYPLPIHREDDIPKDDKAGVIKTAKEIQSETSGCQRQVRLDNSGTNQDTPRKFWSNKVTLVPEMDYDRLYPKVDVLLPFPVTSNPSFEDTLDPEDESEYDMDSDDEEWLEEHSELRITPARFEYIFTKLNKRNTHVKDTAMGALRSTFHEDFLKIFPYWKEKRLRNQNVSTWRAKQQSRKGDRMSGYISTDPFLVFSEKLDKPIPTHLKGTKPTLGREELELCIQRTEAMRDMLLKLKVWTQDMGQSSDQDRLKIVEKLKNLDLIRGNRLVSLPETAAEEHEPTVLLGDCDENNNSVSLNRKPIKRRKTRPRLEKKKNLRKIPQRGSSVRNNIKANATHRQRFQFEDVINQSWQCLRRSKGNLRSSKENIHFDPFQLQTNSKIYAGSNKMSKKCSPV